MGARQSMPHNDGNSSDVNGPPSMKLARTIDRIGQNFISNFTNLCYSNFGNDYTPMRHDKNECLITRDGGSDYMVEEYQSSCSLINPLILDRPCGTEFHVNIANNEHPRNDHLLLAQNAKTIRDRLEHLCNAIRCSHYVPLSPNSDRAVTFSNSKPLTANLGQCALAFGMEDILFEVSGGHDSITFNIEDADIFYEIGMMLSSFETALYPLALKALDIARKLDGRVDLHCSFIQLMLRLNRFDTSIEELVTLCKEFESSAMLKWQMAIALLGDSPKKTDFELSYQYLQQAMLIDPENQEYRETAGSTLQKLADYHKSENCKSLLLEAKSMYKEAYAQGPTNQIKQNIDTIEKRLADPVSLKFSRFEMM